jgi:hypothetical protein
MFISGVGFISRYVHGYVQNISGFVQNISGYFRICSGYQDISGYVHGFKYR